MQDKSRTKPLMRQMIEMNGTGFLVWWIRYQLRATAFFLPPGALWEHVRIFKCLVATQSHDVRLVRASKWTYFIGKDNAQFLAFSPVWTMFIQQVVEDLSIAEDKGISRTVLPTKIHGGRFYITVPGVNDVLADVVQQDVNRQSTSLGRVDQGVEVKQGVFLHPSK